METKDLIIIMLVVILGLIFLNYLSENYVNYNVNYIEQRTFNRTDFETKVAINQTIANTIIDVASFQTQTGKIYHIKNNKLELTPIQELCQGGSK